MSTYTNQTVSSSVSVLGCNTLAVSHGEVKSPGNGVGEEGLLEARTCFLDDGHSAWGEMKSQSSFVLHFLDG